VKDVDEAITRQRIALPLMSFQRTAKTDKLLLRTIRLLHGRS
jgi:hypothetical protein